MGDFRAYGFYITYFYQFGRANYEKQAYLGLSYVRLLSSCSKEASSEQSETADIESSEYDIPFVDVDESEPASESSIIDNDVLDTENQEALSAANKYLNNYCISKQKLVKYLEQLGFSEDASCFAVDNCGADWNEQALLTAKQHLVLKRTRKQLINFLKELGFTDLQAEYAADNYR